MAPSTLLRGPGLLRIGELVEPLVNGPFDFAQGSCLFALRDPGLLRIGELVEPSINGPFDIALRLTLRGPAILFCYIGFSV